MGEKKPADGVIKLKRTTSRSSSRTSSHLLEKRVQNQILEWSASRDDLRLWRANTGVALTLDGKRKVRFGVKGQADLTGILSDGRRLEIEVKRPGQCIRAGSPQAKWRDMILAMGGVHIEATCVEDVERVLG